MTYISNKNIAANTINTNKDGDLASIYNMKHEDQNKQIQKYPQLTAKDRTLQPPYLQAYVPFFQYIHMETSLLYPCIHLQPIRCLLPVNIKKPFIIFTNISGYPQDIYIRNKCSTAKT